MVLNRAFRLTAVQVAAAMLALDNNEHKKHGSLSNEFSSDENSVEDIIDEDADTHNLNRLMIVGVQFVPEPDDRDSFLIDRVSCYIFTCNLK